MALAADYTDKEAWAAWDHWKHQPLTESNFLAICDLLQDIGKSNIQISAGDAENLSFLYTFGAMGHVHNTAAMGRDLAEAVTGSLKQNGFRIRRSRSPG